MQRYMYNSIWIWIVVPLSVGFCFTISRDCPFSITNGHKNCIQLTLDTIVMCVFVCSVPSMVLAIGVYSLVHLLDRPLAGLARQLPLPPESFPQRGKKRL